MQNSSVRLAFENVQGAVFQMNDALMRQGIEASRESPRKRFILPIHRTQDAPVQRMMNFLQPGTYVRPHLHPRKGAVETLVIVQGAILFRQFDDEGRVLLETECRAGAPSAVLDIEPETWHSFDVLEADTVLFESKMGPYDVNLDKIFAPWSEEERF